MDSRGCEGYRGEMRFCAGRMCRNEGTVPGDDGRQQQTTMTTDENN